MKTISHLIIVFIFVFFIKVINTQAFSGNGSGTQLDPYVITSSDQLEEMNDDLDAAYILAKDIDMLEINWFPVGTYGDPFVGTFNGAGYSIENLSSVAILLDYVYTEAYTMGLFGVVADNAQIYNLGLEINYYYFSPFDGKDFYVGGLVGDVEGSNVSIHDIWVSGSIDLTPDYGHDFANIGGVIGYSNNLNIYGVSFTGDISIEIGSLQALNLGGIIGYSINTSLRESRVYDSSIMVYSEPYNIYVGGLIGEAFVHNTWMNEAGYGIISQSEVDTLTIDTGDLDASMGGLLGYVYNDSYTYNASTEMLDLVDNTIEENWVRNITLSNGLGYTGGLVGDAEYVTISKNQVESVMSGDGISSVGYTGGLVGFGYHLTIELNRVLNLYLSAGLNSYALGGVAGYIESSYINKTYVSGELSSTSNNVGGIVGEGLIVDISNTFFEGSLIGSRGVGGLIGNASGIVNLDSSWTKGDYNASEFASGGLIGYAGDVDLVITDCYSLASVGELDKVGGLIGVVVGSSVEIYRSYFGGLVSGETSIDGIIGSTGASSVFSYLLYYDDANGVASDGVGVPSADLKNAASNIAIAFEANSNSPWFLNGLNNEGYLGIYGSRQLIRLYNQGELIDFQLSWGQMNSLEDKKLDKSSLFALTNLNPNVDYTIYWGVLVEKPSDPTRESYVFEGWYTEPEFTNPWDFNQETDGDKTLYAKWTAGIPGTGDVAGLSNALLGLGGILIMATKRRKF